MSEQALEASGARYLPNTMGRESLITKFTRSMASTMNMMTGVAFGSVSSLTTTALDFANKFKNSLMPVTIELDKLANIGATIGLVGAAIDPRDRHGTHKIYRESVRTKAALRGLKETEPKVDETMGKVREIVASPSNLMDYVYGKGKDNYDLQKLEAVNRLNLSVQSELEKARLSHTPGYRSGRRRK